MARKHRNYNDDKPALKVGRKCSRCLKVKKDVQVVDDPYSHEVENEIKIVALCGDCYTAALEDI